MRKKLLSVLAVAGFVLGASAQSGISITLEGQTTDLSGQTYTVNNAGTDVNSISFAINNNTGSGQQWRITRYQISVTSGWSDYLCWGASNDPFGTCYSASQMSSNPWTSAGSQAIAFTINDGDYGKLVADVDPDDNTPGAGHYRYYVSTDGSTYLDSVDLIVSNSSLSATTVKQQEVSLVIAPNPADDILTLNVNGMDNVTIKMVDVLGNVVMRETAVYSSSKKIDVSSFKNGVYFITVEASGMKPMTRKVVVRH